MAIQLLIRDPNNDAAKPQLVSSTVTLSGADEVLLAEGTPNILGVDKRGADLTISFVDEQELELKDFFVIGPQGDFNKLFTSDGEIVASALTAPEVASDDMGPDDDIGPTGLPFTAQGVGTELDETSGGLPVLGNLDSQDAVVMLAGTGLAFGFGSMLDSPSDEGDDSQAGAEEAAAFVSEIDALLGDAATESETGALLSGDATGLLANFEDNGHLDSGRQTEPRFDDRTLVADPDEMLSGTIEEFDLIATLFDEVEL